MINSKNLNYVQVPLVILTLVYLFVEIPYAIVFLWIGYGLVSLNVFMNGVRFKAKRNDLIELGRQENFNGGLLAVLIFFIVIAISVYLGTQIAKWDALPVREEEISPYFIIIIALPKFTQFVLRVVFKGFTEYLYLTDKGLLFNMNIKEHYTWKDFQSYAMLPDLKLIRFRKEKGSKSSFFFVSYDMDDFGKNKGHILRVLDKNLKREIE